METACGWTCTCTPMVAGNWRRLLGLWVPVVYPVKLDPNGAAQLEGGLVLVHLWQLAGVGRSVDWGGSWWAIYQGVAKTYVDLAAQHEDG